MIKSQYTFDNPNEIVYDTSLIEVVTQIDNETLVNPFVSGTTIFSGTVDGDYSSGYVTPDSFYEVVSGGPWMSSGEVVFFDFGEPRKIHSVSVYQHPDRYAVSYTISGDSTPLIHVQGSTNSGTLSHRLAQPFEARTVTIGVFEINAQPSNSGLPTYYEFIEVSGEANMTFVESNVVMADTAHLTATSVVEPVENLFDNDPLTFWQSNNNFPQTIVWTFKNFENLASFHYVSEDTTTYPTQFQLYSSLDGTNYGLILQRSSTNPMTSGELLSTFSPVVTTKYLKWIITAGVGSKTRIQDVFITRRTFPQVDVDLIRMQKSTRNGYITPVSLSASSQSGTAVVSNIVSTDTTKFWNSNGSFIYGSGTASYTGVEYIQADLGSPVTLDSAAWVNRDGNGVPIDFQINGSNDNITYTQLAAFTGNAQDTGNVDFSDVVNTYRFYRLVFTNSTHNFVRIHHAELNLRSYPTVASAEIPAVLADSIASYEVSGSIPFPATDVKYQINVDARPYWFNGSSWALTTGLSDSNTLSTLNSNITALPFSENFKIGLIPVFQSDGTDTAEITGVNVTHTNEKNSEFVPKHMIRIRGFLSGFPASVKKPIQLQVNLIRSVITIDGQTIGSAVQTFNSDNTGFFDFELPQTENASPAKARWGIVIQIFNFRTERYTPALTEISLSDWLSGNF